MNFDVSAFGNFLLISSTESFNSFSFRIKGVCSSIPSIKDVSP